MERFNRIMFKIVFVCFIFAIFHTAYAYHVNRTSVADASMTITIFLGISVAGFYLENYFKKKPTPVFITKPEFIHANRQPSDTPRPDKPTPAPPVIDTSGFTLTNEEKRRIIKERQIQEGKWELPAEAILIPPDTDVLTQAQIQELLERR